VFTIGEPTHVARPDSRVCSTVVLGTDIGATDESRWRSFFHGPKRGSTQANRIFRVTRSSPAAPTKLKLAITSRLTEDLDLSFGGNEEDPRYLIDRELRLWNTHFESSG
jgi:hypothetical protein